MISPKELSFWLDELLTYEDLPYLDRWFSAEARLQRLPPAKQKALWDALRRALTRTFLLSSKSTWPEVRRAMRGRADDWASMAFSEAPISDPSGAGIPPWLVPEWEQRCRLSRWSEKDEQKFFQAQETPPPAYVRFRFGAEGDACRDRMQASGAVKEFEGGYLLSGGPGLEHTEDWKRGWVEIQDASSQHSLDDLVLRPGMRVWDVCAGHGGKTLLAANELRGKGSVVATDIAESKLRSLKDRVRRSGWQNIRILGWDGESLPDFGPEFAAKGFDRVVVDAPCTATGTWRRDPEARLRLTPGDREELRSHQQRLLRLGWNALRQGGRLAYVTCSWLPSENEDVVDAFVRESGAREVSRKLLGLPETDANTLFASTLEKP